MTSIAFPHIWVVSADEILWQDTELPEEAFGEVRRGVEAYHVADFIDLVLLLGQQAGGLAQTHLLDEIVRSHAAGSLVRSNRTERLRCICSAKSSTEKSMSVNLTDTISLIC